MAIFHVRVKTFSRSKNQSAVAAAAYRGAMLLAEPNGELHDYRARRGVLRTRCFVPGGSPAWADDPQALWTAAEAAEKRKDSTLCRNFCVSLPHELNHAQRWDLIEDLAHRLVDRYGFAIQASSHAPVQGDPRHFYAQLLVTTRKMTPEGLAAKTRELDGPINGRTEVEWVRAMVAAQINAHLSQAGVQVRIDEPYPVTTATQDMRADSSALVDGEAGFASLLNRYRSGGVLMGVPEGHTAERAFAERLLARGANRVPAPQNQRSDVRAGDRAGEAMSDQSV
ncbi:MobA/MobL family protein [Xanthomonas perforans]|nr:MobA/MobL family protein [Xanthomonas perforans]MBZ2690770.1 MobA/MobL family protein [Xanthomonas perforans]MBZ2707975.1 MobA/MobL family protein [Xanthomonas perforans]MBZ2822824.1 MobA/MobL family protein [Xanthomonas perforans]MBZ2839402.1 MobA/MobL family protein [Xanthomonas perforans]